MEGGRGNRADPVANKSTHFHWDEAALRVTVTELSTVSFAPGEDIACSRHRSVESFSGRDANDADARHRRKNRGRWNNEIVMIQ